MKAVEKMAESSEMFKPFHEDLVGSREEDCTCIVQHPISVNDMSDESSSEVESKVHKHLVEAQEDGTCIEYNPCEVNDISDESSGV